MEGEGEQKRMKKRMKKRMEKRKEKANGMETQASRDRQRRDRQRWRQRWRDGETQRDGGMERWKWICIVLLRTEKVDGEKERKRGRTREVA